MENAAPQSSRSKRRKKHGRVCRKSEIFRRNGKDLFFLLKQKRNTLEYRREIVCATHG